MKKRLILLLLIIYNITFSQTQSKTKKVVQLIESQDIYINSATNIGGKTRTYYKIDLPDNTIEWYYSFTTTANPNNSGMKLLQQVSSLISANPLVNIAVSSISVESGVYPIDIFLFNKKGLDEFLKKDFFGSYEYSRPSHYTEGTSLNTKQGKIKINDIIRGTVFIGLRNPSINTGVNVKIEVVAIVEETIIDNSKWSKETKQKLYDLAINSILNTSLNNSQKEEYAYLMVSKITEKYVPDDFDQLAEFEIKNLLKKIMSECDKELNVNLSGNN